ncbi:MAG: PfkB family carbohydrate kinase [Desulfurococcaceae archaeon]|nr:PfkB family carbohydrate kinase [Desulfurococcaceae archaeon]
MAGEWHLSVGNVNVDLSLILDGYPVAGVNVVARDLWFGVGGAAVNYASCIVRLGGRASVVSLVSPHAVRLGVLDWLSRLGVDSSYVRVVDGEPSVAVILMVPGESLRTIVSYRGVSRMLNPDMIPDAGDHVHFASVNPSLVVGAAAKLGSRSSSYDPGGEAYRDPAGVREALAYVNRIFVNERELEALVGAGDPLEARRLLGGKTEIVVVKRGPRGAVAVTKDEIVEVRAPKVEKVDVTGTGDAFDAAFNIYYQRTGDLGEALKHAVATGALKATIRGSSNMPSREEVEKLASQLNATRAQTKPPR